MQDKYWKLRKECEEAFYKYRKDRTDESLFAYRVAFSKYQDLCMDILEAQVDKNPDILKEDM